MAIKTRFTVRQVSQGHEKRACRRRGSLSVFNFDANFNRDKSTLPTRPQYADNDNLHFGRAFM